MLMLQQPQLVPHALPRVLGYQTQGTAQSEEEVGVHEQRAENVAAEAILGPCRLHPPQKPQLYGNTAVDTMWQCSRRHLTQQQPAFPETQSSCHSLPEALAAPVSAHRTTHKHNNANIAITYNNARTKVHLVRDDGVFFITSLHRVVGECLQTLHFRLHDTQRVAENTAVVPGLGWNNELSSDRFPHVLLRGRERASTCQLQPYTRECSTDAL